MKLNRKSLTVGLATLGLVGVLGVGGAAVAAAAGPDRADSGYCNSDDGMSGAQMHDRIDHMMGRQMSGNEMNGGSGNGMLGGSGNGMMGN